MIKGMRAQHLVDRVKRGELKSNPKSVTNSSSVKEHDKFDEHDEEEASDDDTCSNGTEASNGGETAIKADESTEPTTCLDSKHVDMQESILSEKGNFACVVAELIPNQDVKVSDGNVGSDGVLIEYVSDSELRPKSEVTCRIISFQFSSCLMFNKDSSEEGEKLALEPEYLVSTGDDKTCIQVVLKVEEAQQINEDELETDLSSLSEPNLVAKKRVERVEVTKSSGVNKACSELMKKLNEVTTTEERVDDADSLDNVMGEYVTICENAYEVSILFVLPAKPPDKVLIVYDTKWYCTDYQNIVFFSIQWNNCAYWYGLKTFANIFMKLELILHQLLRYLYTHTYFHGRWLQFLRCENCYYLFHIWCLANAGVITLDSTWAFILYKKRIGVTEFKCYCLRILVTNNGYKVIGEIEIGDKYNYEVSSGGITSSQPLMCYLLLCNLDMNYKAVKPIATTASCRPSHYGILCLNLELTCVLTLGLICLADMKLFWGTWFEFNSVCGGFEIRDVLVLGLNTCMKNISGLCAGSIPFSSILSLLTGNSVDSFLGEEIWGSMDQKSYIHDSIFSYDLSVMDHGVWKMNGLWFYLDYGHFKAFNVHDRDDASAAENTVDDNCFRYMKVDFVEAIVEWMFHKKESNFGFTSM